MSHTCIRRFTVVGSFGTGLCWGANVAGQVGTGSTTGYYTTPVQVVNSTGINGDMHSLAAGMEFTCGLRFSTNPGQCWGANGFGQLGNNSLIGSRVPVATVGGPQFTWITAGREHACGLTSPDSKLYCWGRGSEGQLGNGSTANRDADRLLGAKHYAVVVPLSAVLDASSPSEVRSWAQEQRSVTPEAVRQYVTAWLTARHSWERQHRPAYVAFSCEVVRSSHKAWIAKNPNATLGDLVAYLDAARAEFMRFDEDDLLADHIDDLNEAAAYLAGWGDVTKPVFGDEPPTFGYRFANLEGDIDNVDELIGLLALQENRGGIGL